MVLFLQVYGDAVTDEAPMLIISNYHVPEKKSACPRQAPMGISTCLVGSTTANCMLLLALGPA